MDPKYIVALEIGSSHIRAAVGTTDADNNLQLLAIEDEQAVDVVRYGIIQNVDEVSNRVNRLIRKLENYPSIYPRKIKGVYVAVGGRSAMSTSRQVVRQFDEETSISPEIIAQMKEEAKTLALSDRTILQILPRDYMVDNMHVHNPVGTLGKNIRADISLITCKPKLERNLEVALTNRHQLSIKGKITRQTAIADMVLTPEEKSLGCMLVDFGAETTTLSIYKNNALQFLMTLPIGSRNITRDVMSLKFSEERAEEIKRAIGDAFNPEPNYRKLDFDGDVVEVNNYIRARAGEIVANIVEQAKCAGFMLEEDLPSGIILVGGGAKLKGFSDLLANQSNMKVRLGTVPAGIRISNPSWQGMEKIDIIAILSEAVNRGAVDCMETPHVEMPTPDYEDDDPDGPGPRPRATKGGRKANTDEVETTPKTPPTPSFWKKITNRVQQTLTKDIFTEPDDE